MHTQHQSEAPVEDRPYGTLKRLCGSLSGLLQSRNVDLKLLTIRPGLETSHHYHTRSESIFHVLRGNLFLRSERARVEAKLRKGDTVVVKPGEDHTLKNTGREAALVFEIQSPPYSPDDKIALPRNTDRLAG